MLAVLGWVVGIPLGYLIERAFVWLVRELLEVEVVVVYPLARGGRARGHGCARARGH